MEWEIPDEERDAKLGQIVQAVLADLPEHFKRMDAPSEMNLNNSGSNNANKESKQLEIITKLDKQGNKTIKHGTRKLLNQFN